MRFEDLPLSDNILDALYDMRFEECTPIQEATIPAILDGKDVMGCAQTGTGKTAAYLLPILSRLDDCHTGYDDSGELIPDKIHCIIMSPTRELAQQIDQAMQGFSYYLDGIGSIPVYGGNDGNRYDQEYKSLKAGADVVIATPGRLISHIQMGNTDFSNVKFFILDEADRMLDMGFSEDIMKIASYLPKEHQTIMFSATMPTKIQQLAETLMHEPEIIKLSVSKPAEKIQQSCVYCENPQKMKVIEHFFTQNPSLTRVIIFAGKKGGVKDVNRALKRMKIKSGEMHSDLSQAERDEMMFLFKSGQLDVIVATDILARGIDIDDIQMVINFDVPHDAEDYVHRIGRTARAERDGIAITFVNSDDRRYFADIERFLEYRIKINEEASKAVGAPLEAPKNERKTSLANKGKGRRRHGAKGKATLNAEGGNANGDLIGNTSGDAVQKKKQRKNKRKGKGKNANKGGGLPEVTQQPHNNKDTNPNKGGQNAKKGKKVHPIKQPDRPQQ